MSFKDTITSEDNQTVINRHYKSFKDIYVCYRSLIRPYIAALELLDKEFPVEILNEIRAIFQHFARCYNIDSQEDADAVIATNTEKAKSHLKRALLDCYKYSCLSLYDECISFEKMYRFADLSTLDDGKFLSEKYRLKERAIELDREARILEGDYGATDVVYEKYESAFNASVELHKYISLHAPYATNLKHKFVLYNFFSALGYIIGIVTGILELWSKCGSTILSYFAKH